jgi:predicted nucleic acid-binding Zn ribbon protein
MPPIREYLCDYCGHQFDEIVSDPEDYAFTDCRCGSKAQVLPALPSTARGGFGTPRRDASREKVQKFNFKNDEPKGEQLELDFNKKDSG